MSDTLIKVSNLSKKYVISHQRQERYTALRDVMANNVKRLGRKLLSPFTHNHSPATDTSEDFYALKDVSFEIKQGDRVGIIGRNGAGKSTLLKILSRITEPTSGRIEITGRVASLLEVGTGFHPELTGRENIFLNGAILGMTRAEIRKKFDEIVAFAEIEKFLDTPVKRYSSGMYVRLAFAVAAHLEPEILIVDEVLAVGDAQFQKKCLGKMEEVGREGRTVLFVSHNLSAIGALCERALLLKHGQLAVDDVAGNAIDVYLNDISTIEVVSLSQQSNGEPKIRAVRLLNQQTERNDFIQVEVQLSSKYQKKISLDVRLLDECGTPVGYSSLGTLDPEQKLLLSEGDQIVSFGIFVNQLAVGRYYLSLDLNDPYVEIFDRAEKCLAFEVTRPPAEGNSLVLQQSWRYGCYEFPIQLIAIRKNI